MDRTPLPSSVPCPSVCVRPPSWPRSACGTAHMRNWITKQCLPVFVPSYFPILTSITVGQVGPHSYLLILWIIIVHIIIFRKHSYHTNSDIVDCAPQYMFIPQQHLIRCLNFKPAIRDRHALRHWIAALRSASADLARKRSIRINNSASNRHKYATRGRQLTCDVIINHGVYSPGQSRLDTDSNILCVKLDLILQNEH